MSLSNFVKCNPINLIQCCGYSRYHLVEKKKFHILSTECIDVFCTICNTDGDNFLYISNWDGVCLLRGTSSIFMSSHRGGPDSIQDQSVEIYGRQSGAGRCSSLSVSFYQCSYTSSSTCCSYKKRQKGPFQKPIFLRKTRSTGQKISLFFWFQRVKVKLNYFLCQLSAYIWLRRSFQKTISDFTTNRAGVTPFQK